MWLGCPNRDSSIGTIEPQSLNPKIKLRRSASALFQLDFRVAELVKSFGRRGKSESLYDFRYGPTLIFNWNKALGRVDIYLRVTSVDATHTHDR